MFLDSEDFKSVWQVAHNWVDEDPSETDVKSISPKLKTAIHRLMHAMACYEISVRSRRGQIFEDDSLLSIVFDFSHYLKFYQCLRKNKFNKSYLDNLYVKRNEVINWCANVAYLEPPPCWPLKQLSDSSRNISETKKYRPANEGEDRIRCQAIASALWELDPDIHPSHLVQSTILQRFGNGREYNEETTKNWIIEVDPLKGKRKTGRPPNKDYKIFLKTDPKYQD